MVVAGGRHRLRSSRVLYRFRRFGYRMVMGTTISMHVLRGTGSVLMNVHNAPAVLVFGQAGGTRAVRDCK